MWWKKEKTGGVVTEVKSVTGYECSIHGHINESTCPYCDLCEHGKMRTQHCDECAADDSWLKAPISDSELESLLRTFTAKGTYWGSGPWRHAPKPRIYVSMPLIGKALVEYAELRKRNGALARSEASAEVGKTGG